MDLPEQNILFFPRTMGLGGTEKVVLQLCEIFKPLVNKIVVCSCGGENVKYLEMMGIRHYMIPDIESKSLIVMLKTAREIRKIVKDENITVIHTHHRMAAFYVATLRLFTKCSFINTSHNTFYDKKSLTAFAYKHARLVACGEMVKKNLVDYFGLPDENVTVIRNAVAPFEGRIEKNETIEKLRSKGCFVVGNIGRLTEQKGFEYYIRALPKVHKSHPEVHFLIIGTGELEQKLRDLSKQLGVENEVHFLGYHSDIQNLISQVDLVVLSSLWEGLPLTPIEAFSVGKTVVATAVDGTVEIVEDGKNGFLVEPRKPEQIAEKVIWMIEHPHEKKRMEQEAQKGYEQNFSMERLSKAYIDFYERNCHERA